MTTRERNIERMNEELEKIREKNTELSVNAGILLGRKRVDFAIAADRVYGKPFDLDRLKELRDQIRNSKLPTEWKDWFDDAVGLLGQFMEAMNVTVDKLDARQADLESELEAWETRGNSSDEEEEGRYYDRQRV